MVIADANGKTIKQIPLPIAANGSITIDASTLGIGSFTYTIVADGKTVQSKNDYGKIDTGITNYSLKGR